jgi:hypothetical protein
MRRTRQVLAVMLVTTALCADRGAAALSVVSQPQARTHADTTGPETRGSFFQRLTRTLIGRVSVVLLRQSPVGTPVATLVDRASRDRASFVPHRQITPFQFRLPPPAF